jgi:exodeoxyribonuclease-3
MNIISFNVNGIRAVVGKTFITDMQALNPDIICLQETKATPEQVQDAVSSLKGYHVFASSAERKGYSGTAILSKEMPLNVTYGIGIAEHDNEGRVICAEYDNFFWITVNHYSLWGHIIVIYRIHHPSDVFIHMYI